MSQPHHPYPSILRYCASCVVTLAFWSVWLVLGAVLAMLAYIAVLREFPVPGMVVRRLERDLASSNFALQFGRIHFEPNGNVLFENAALRSLQFEEPLLVSRMVYVRARFWSMLAGRLVPDEIRLEGATLQLPAMISPSGTAEALVRDLALTIHPVDQGWKLDQLTFRTGPLAVTAFGEFTVPRSPAASKPVDVPAVLTLYYDYGKKLAVQLEHLRSLEQPALGIRVQSVAGNTNSADLVFTAAAITQAVGPTTLRADDVSAATTIRLERSQGLPVRLQLAARRVDAGGRLQAEHLRALVAAVVGGQDAPVSVREVDASAARVRAEGIEARAPVVHADLDELPRVRAGVSLVAGTRPVRIEGQADTRARSAEFRLSTVVDPLFLNNTLKAKAPKAAPYLILQDPLAIDAGVALDPGWKVRRIAGRIDGGRLEARDVPISGVHSHLEFDGRNLRASDVLLELKDNFARGSYWMDTSTRDYRMLLTGQLRPMAIVGWFRGAWWPNLWGNFDYPAVPPVADVDVGGQWGNPSLSHTFDTIDAPGAVVRGARFDRLLTRVFTRPQVVHGLVVEGSRNQGRERIEGTFKRHALAGGDSREIEFVFNSNADPEIYDLLFQGSARSLLDEWKFSRAPSIRVQGSWFPGENGGHTDLAFSASVDGGLKYLGFPLDTLTAEGGVSGRDLRIDRVDFSTAGGTGSGKISLSGPRKARLLGFDLYVKDADLSRTVHAVQEYLAANSGEPRGPDTNNPFMQRAGSAKLEAAISAQGKPGDLASFRGSGNGQLRGATLSEIHLFGLLSQVLSGLSLNFSTLKLDTMKSSFELSNAQLHFPDMKVTGPNSVIDLRGSYSMQTGNVAFTGRFKPYEQGRNIFTGALGLVLNPLTSIIELKLNGPLRSPQWTYSLGQSAAERPAGLPAPVPEAKSAGAATQPKQ